MTDRSRGLMAMGQNPLYGGTGILSDDRFPYRREYNNALMPSPVTPESRAGRTSQSYGIMANPAPRPSDWAESSGVAETLSPTMGAYGMGQGLGTTTNALMQGDYTGAAESGLPLAAMAFMPGRGTGIPRANFALDYFGKPVNIMQNPSNSQLQGAMNKTKYKAMRRIQDQEGNTYVWDAADPALHNMVAEKMGIDPKTLRLSDMIEMD